MDNDTSVQPQPFIMEGTRNGGSPVRTTGRLDSYGVGKLPAAWWFPAPRGVEFQCPHGLELLQELTIQELWCNPCFNALMGLSCYMLTVYSDFQSCGFNALMGLSCYLGEAYKNCAANMFQCPHGLELLLGNEQLVSNSGLFQCPHGLELLREFTKQAFGRCKFQCPHGLELLRLVYIRNKRQKDVSMPSWAWVVTARMSNILNFSWYFLCIPAIYKCILAYLPIFFNQLSKFLRCESPSTFLGTCLSHHSFIIFLVTNINTLLSGLYLISTGAII